MDYSSIRISFSFHTPSMADSTKHVDLRSPVIQNAINNTNPTHDSLPFVCQATTISGFQTTLNRSCFFVPQDHKNHTENLFSIDTF